MRYRIPCFKCGWEVLEHEAVANDDCPPRYYCEDCFNELKEDREEKYDEA